MSTLRESIESAARDGVALAISGDDAQRLAALIWAAECAMETIEDDIARWKSQYALEALSTPPDDGR